VVGHRARSQASDTLASAVVIATIFGSAAGPAETTCAGVATRDIPFRMASGLPVSGRRTTLATVLASGTSGSPASISAAGSS